MARSYSWLPLARRIRETVQSSAITHRDRRELQRMFQIGRSAAGNLLREILPTTALGQANMVSKDDLLKFLDHVIEADDVTQACIALKAEKENVSRRRPRSLVRHDFEPVDPASLSPWIGRGRVSFDFRDPAEVFDVMYRFACAVQGDGLEEFIRLYAPAKPVSLDRELELADVQALREEVEQMEAEWLRLHRAS